MKMFCLTPLLFLSACSNPPKLVLQPQRPPAMEITAGVRYPEVLHAYHVGRYADPNDNWLMHEQHVVYRVEKNARWNLRPAAVETTFILPSMPISQDAPFSPLPVNDAVLAEVNAQKLATGQIMMQARTLSSALAGFQTALQQTRTNLQETATLRASVNKMQKRLDCLAAATSPPSASTLSTTNEPVDSLSP